jgi:L-alanine-DL-glutamate epimerase-like enolase superfamily enzyme
MAGPDGAALEAAESIEPGFRCVKFKVGYPHVEQDRAMIRAARGAAGKDLQVMVDYNPKLAAKWPKGCLSMMTETALKLKALRKAGIGVSSALAKASRAYLPERKPRFP